MGLDAGETRSGTNFKTFTLSSKCVIKKVIQDFLHRSQKFALFNCQKLTGFCSNFISARDKVK
jgi:hypothetical protein